MEYITQKSKIALAKCLAENRQNITEQKISSLMEKTLRKFHIHIDIFYTNYLAIQDPSTI